MSRKKNFVKNLIILSFGTVLPKFAAFFTLPILLRCLSTDVYGDFDYFQTLVSLLLPVITLQIQTAAFRFLIDYRDDEKVTKQIVSNIYFFAIPTSVIALTIMYFCLFRFSVLTRLIICLYFFIDILFRVTQQVVRGFAKNKLFSTSAIIESLINLVLVVILVKEKGAGLEGALLAVTIADFLALCYTMFRGKVIRYIHITSVSKEMLIKMIKYSWPMIPNSLSGWVLNFSDRQVLRMVMGPGVQGIYSAATKLPSILNVVQSSFTQAWQENASVASKDSDASEYYSAMFDTIYRFMAGTMAILIAATPITFKIFIASKYDEAYIHICILYLGAFFDTVKAYLGGIYVAKMKTKSVGITTIIAAVLNLTIDLTMVWKFGIFAASISTLVSCAFLAIYRMFDVQKIQKIKFDIPKVIMLPMVLMAMCVICSFRTLPFNCLNAVIGVGFAVLFNRDIIRTLLLKVKEKM